MEQVERLDRLVDSILASVRIVPAEAATVTPIDVESTIGEVVASIRPIVRQHHLEVRPGLGLHALADGPRLRQILEHLIENAVKYAPPETTMRSCAGMPAPGSLWATSLWPGRKKRSICNRSSF